MTQESGENACERKGGLAILRVVLFTFHLQLRDLAFAAAALNDDMKSLKQEPNP
jgi:hypothetical protein